MPKCEGRFRHRLMRAFMVSLPCLDKSDKNGSLFLNRHFTSAAARSAGPLRTFSCPTFRLDRWNDDAAFYGHPATRISLSPPTTFHSSPSVSGLGPSEQSSSTASNKGGGGGGGHHYRRNPTNFVPYITGERRRRRRDGQTR